ncbi:MAG: DNA polymerase III subunit alpha, partial [Bacteroidales bacterium]
MKNFVHLHLHTQYSILDGAANIERIFNKAQQLEMPAVAITDHGNMYGVLDFYRTSKAYNVKPILGCEIYVARRSMANKENDIDRSGFHLILLAKNLTGYHNIIKLVSKASLDGFYYTPRIDKELLTQYHEGLIASSACLGGEIPYYLRQNNIEKARQAVGFYKDLFGEDFYLELQNHGLEEQAKINHEIKSLADEFGIKTIITNDVHFVNKEDKEAHSLLIKLNTNRDDSTLLYTGNEYLKSYDEMLQCFPDDEASLLNTLEIAEKVESYSIENEVILPKYTLPDDFTDDFDYLKHLTYLGAKQRYGELLEAEVKGRIEYELEVIKKMDFAGYFLIVQDYINAAREMGVLVGPGRGSAPGSIVSYCIGITNVEPLKYKLLFERFLNPERISMPDIDVDFDDAGRQKVLNYVVEKYGNNRVAQIVSFQTMQARMAVRDVCRVKGIPLSKADKIAKLIPARPGTKLVNALEESPELKKLYDEDPEVKQVISIAMTLEGNVRSTGVHACGVIISPSDITDFVPLAQAKESPIPVVQYEGSIIESAGMLKMDFLGLKTLSIIKDTLDLIYRRRGKNIDIDKIPLDDNKTFELFQNGATIGVFQFESTGMQKYLRELKPTTIDDLIAMNALYRPGPMSYIPTYINRKHGKEPIEYYHDIMKEVLEDTYGIMIFQEQIMQLSEKMAGFSKAEADTLRKAMGKKKPDLIEQMEVKFIDGCLKNNINRDIAKKVYEDMAQFGGYGFNRSHTVAYSIIAYQTAYLKANFTDEFMASVLTHTSLNELNKILSECERLGIK